MTAASVVKPAIRKAAAAARKPKSARKRGCRTRTRIAISAAAGNVAIAMPMTGLSAISVNNGFISRTWASQIGHTAGSIMA